MIKLMITMVMNYKDENRANRRQSHQAMQLLTIMALQFATPRKVIFGQFDLLFSNVEQFYKGLEATNEISGVEKEEVMMIGALFKKFKSGSLDQSEKMMIIGEEKYLPEEVQLAIKKVAE